MGVWDSLESVPEGFSGAFGKGGRRQEHWSPLRASMATQPRTLRSQKLPREPLITGAQMRGSSQGT